MIKILILIGIAQLIPFIAFGIFILKKFNKK